MNKKTTQVMNNFYLPDNLIKSLEQFLDEDKLEQPSAKKIKKIDHSAEKLSTQEKND